MLLRLPIITERIVAFGAALSAAPNATFLNSGIDALRVPALPSNKREGKKPTMSMNIFRLCGDMSHVFSILVLLLRLRVAKNAQGACAFRLLVNSPLLISHEDAYPVFHCSRNSCQSSRLQVFRCERMNSSSWSLLLGIWIYLRHSTPSTIP